MVDRRHRVEVIAGDARMSLVSELVDDPAGHGFDLLVLDAFSGDGVPLHLLTREAFAVYVSHMAADGMIAHTKWMSPESLTDEARRGQDLFTAWCMPCHTTNGYNGLAPFLAYWNEETVASLVPRLEHMRALMPPWYGTEEENAALVTHLMSLKPAEPGVMPADRQAARVKAFTISCGLCHTPNGFRSLADSFEDMDAEEIDEFLDEAGDLTEEMPGYFGTDEQRELLIEYLDAFDETATRSGGSES